MEETKFWDMVAEFNWRENFKKTRFALIELKLRLAQKYSREQFSEFHKVAGEKAIIIAEAIVAAIGKEERRRISGEYRVDFADIHDHAVGLGREFYFSALANPLMLVAPEYIKDVKVSLSFAFAPPSMSEYYVFEEEYFPGQIEIFCRNKFDLIAANPLAECFDESFAVIREVINLMQLGKLEKLPRAQYVYKLWRSLERQAASFSGYNAESLREALKGSRYLVALVKEANVVVKIRREG